MAYHIDAEKISLDDLQERIESSDLVPSRACLKEGIREKFDLLKAQGIHTFANLRRELKNAEKMKKLAALTGIDAGYLNLLRREIESYFPKPYPLQEFNWIAAQQIDRLAAGGISTTLDYFELAAGADGRDRLASLGVDEATAGELCRLCDLTRVQWTSPLSAKMLLEAGYGSAVELANAEPGALCAALERVNADNRFFKGKLGQRDIKRWIHSAGYV